MKTLVKIFLLASLVLLVAGTAMAYETQINSPSDDQSYYSPLSVELAGYGGILDRLYGWDNLERVDDANDQTLFAPAPGYYTAMRIVAKYANYGHQIGYSTDANSNSDYSDDINWVFDLANNSYAKPDLSNNFEGLGAFTTIGDTTKIALFLDPSPPVANEGNINMTDAPVWSSIESLNTLGPLPNPLNPSVEDSQRQDHMVTYRIKSSNGGFNNIIGDYVMGFEDNWAGNPLRLADWDFNDVVLEIDPKVVTPEPATFLLLGIGLVGIGVFGRKRFGK